MGTGVCGLNGSGQAGEAGCRSEGPSVRDLQQSRRRRAPPWPAAMLHVPPSAQRTLRLTILHWGGHSPYAPQCSAAPLLSIHQPPAAAQSVSTCHTTLGGRATPAEKHLSKLSHEPLIAAWTLQCLPEQAARTASWPGAQALSRPAGPSSSQLPTLGLTLSEPHFSLLRSGDSNGTGLPRLL